MLSCAAIVCTGLLFASPSGHYADEVLRDRDGVVMRWNREPQQPIRVFVSTTADAAGSSVDTHQRVRAAFRAWESAAPVRFEFVDDSAAADAHVRFVDRLLDPARGTHINGLTEWTVDDSSRIIGATITFALRRRSGRLLASHAIEAMALHEVGHLLGLAHTRRRFNIMSPTVEVRGLSDADRATAQLLYSLPPGVVK